MLALHLLTAAVFAAASARAGMAARGPGPARQLAIVLAVGAALLAGEKVLRLADRAHEGLHRVGVPDPPLLNGIDDIFLLVGLAAAGLALALLWRQVTAGQIRTAAFAAAALLAGASFLIDALGPAGGALTVAEEWLELGMAGALFAAARTLHAPGATPERGPLTTPWHRRKI